MNSYILLMKNNEIIITPNLDFYFNDIKYILFQADNTLNTYLLHEPKRYMIDMDKAEIVYETVITQQCVEEDIYEEHTKSMSHTEKTVTSLNELMQYLQSLHRIQFFNDTSKSNDCPRYEEIQFCYFKIVIFCNSKKIYKKIVSFSKEKKLFYPSYILDDIREIYDPISKFLDRFLSIDYYKMKWGFYSELYYDDICGILLKSTKTITFFKFINILSLKYRLKSVLTQVILFDPKVISDSFINDFLDGPCLEMQSYSIRAMDKWDANIPDILETITYLPYIFMTFKTTSELFDNGKVNNIYEVRAIITIETDNTDTIQYLVKENDPFLPMDLIKLFNGDDEENE